MVREYQYKILVVGDLGTGKTSLLKRLVYDTFSSNYKSTIGVDFALKVFQLESDIIVSLQLWDIAGQERFGNMTRAYYKGAIGAFVVYDVTRPATFDSSIKWKKDIDDKVRLSLLDDDSLPVVLLANKIDQQANSKTEIEMKTFCNEHGFLHWFETSAKKNTNIVDATKYLIHSIVQLEMSKSSDSEYELLDYNSRSTNDILISYNDNKIQESSRCCS